MPKSLDILKEGIMKAFAYTLAIFSMLLSSNIWAAKSRSNSEVSFTCNTWKPLLSEDQYFTRYANLKGTLIKSEASYSYTGAVDYSIDCEPGVEDLNECWAFDKGNVNNISNDKNYGKHDTHQYKNHILLNLGRRLGSGSNNYAYASSIKFYFPDWVSNLKSGSSTKTFMSYMMLTSVSDHDGGTIPLICNTDKVK